MRCTTCRSGETAPGISELPVQRDGRTYLFRDVPAEICEQCGEAYFDEAVTARVLAQVEAASQAGACLAVLDYRAAG
jgi:YgiT-type zinc finger domain-containing protein